MKKILLTIIAMFSVCSVWASTVAGTTISNQASIEYVIGNSTNKNITQSNVSTFVVNELIDVQISWIDASQIIVNSPDTKKVLTFKLTNTGNGIQKYTLTANNNVGGGNFTPIPNGAYMYIENGLNSGLQLEGAYKDKEYTMNDLVEVEPGEYKNIYLVYDIPDKLAITSKGFSQLNVISTTSGVLSAPKAGTIIEGVQNKESKIDVILGYSLGKAQSVGNYIVSGLIVSHEKTIVSVKDTLGGTMIMSGSEVIYQVKVEISGKGIAKNLTINDTLPNEITYIENSLTLNGNSINNNYYKNGTINLPLGDKNAQETFLLQFKARIK